MISNVNVPIPINAFITINAWVFANISNLFAEEKKKRSKFQLQTNENIFPNGELQFDLSHFRRKNECEKLTIATLIETSRNYIEAIETAIEKNCLWLYKHDAANYLCDIHNSANFSIFFGYCWIQKWFSFDIFFPCSHSAGSNDPLLAFDVSTPK